jgi:hypothetical protein
MISIIGIILLGIYNIPEYVIILVSTLLIFYIGFVVGMAFECYWFICRRNIDPLYNHLHEDNASHNSGYEDFPSICELIQEQNNKQNNGQTGLIRSNSANSV